MCARCALRSAVKAKEKAAEQEVITYVYVLSSRVHLLTVYDKSDRSSISDEEIRDLVDSIMKEINR